MSCMPSQHDSRPTTPSTFSCRTTPPPEQCNLHIFKTTTPELAPGTLISGLAKHLHTQATGNICDLLFEVIRAAAKSPKPSANTGQGRKANAHASARTRTPESKPKSTGCGRDHNIISGTRAVSFGQEAPEGPRGRSPDTKATFLAYTYQTTLLLVGAGYSFYLRKFLISKFPRSRARALQGRTRTFTIHSWCLALTRYPGAFPNS